MKKYLNLKETIFVMSMLFGLFFGAGNLIFPIYMGQLAGQKVWLAILGFLITGVSLPLLAVAALGKSKCNGLYPFACKVSKKFGLLFTCGLYLTIGPFFAIPRCATTSFTVGITPLLNNDSKLVLFIFSLCFFLVASFFVFRANRILTWVGKFLNPLFLIFLTILLAMAFFKPMDNYQFIQASQSYNQSAFFEGFYEGYNTLDALAGLAFGIIVVKVIKDLGIKNGDDIAKNTIIAGISSCLLMGLIYIALALAGAQSSNILGLCSNGGEVLYKLANYYFGQTGNLLLALIVTLACLKTAVGLISSCAQTFNDLFPNKLKLKTWSLIFLLVSFLVANLGLNQIISLSLPVLMFLYPLSIVLIFLGLSSNLFKEATLVYKATIYTCLPFSLLEFLKNLPQESITTFFANLANKLPLGAYGLEWLLPTLIALVLSNIYIRLKK